MGRDASAEDPGGVAAQHARSAKLTTDSGAYAYLAMSSSNAVGELSQVCRWRMALSNLLPVEREALGGEKMCGANAQCANL